MIDQYKTRRTFSPFLPRGELNTTKFGKFHKYVGNPNQYDASRQIPRPTQRNKGRVKTRKRNSGIPERNGIGDERRNCGNGKEDSLELTK
jgi:hypothetical protein